MKKEPLSKITTIAKFGSNTNLARFLGINPSNVTNWKQYIPEKYSVKIRPELKRLAKEKAEEVDNKHLLPYLEQFAKHRAYIGKPMTMNDASYILDQLFSLEEEGIDIKKSIEYSIMQGYSTIVAPKSNIMQNFNEIKDILEKVNNQTQNNFRFDNGSINKQAVTIIENQINEAPKSKINEAPELNMSESSVLKRKQKAYASIVSTFKLARLDRNSKEFDKALDSTLVAMYESGNYSYEELETVQRDILNKYGKPEQHNT